MSPIPQASSYDTLAPVPVNVTPTSLTHLSVVGAFFLVLLLVLVTGILVYCLYKCLTPEDGKPKAPALRPLILSKLVSVNGAAYVVNRNPACELPFEGAPAYTVNENGVKKGIRLYPSSRSSTPTTSPALASTHSTTPQATPTPSLLSNRHGSLSVSPTSGLLPRNHTLPQNNIDLYANPKLFPVQGPIKRMQSFHSTSPAEITTPLAVHLSPLSSDGSSVMTSSYPHLVAQNSPQLRTTTPVSSIKSYASINACPGLKSKRPAADTCKAIVASHPPAIRPAVVSSTTYQLKYSIIPDVADLQTKPMINSFQLRNTQERAPPNALSLTSTKERVLVDLKNKTKLVSVVGPIKPPEVYRSKSRQGPRYKSVTAHKAHVIHRGKENVSIARSAVAYF